LKMLKQDVVNVTSFSYFQQSFSSALSYATSSYKISDRLHEPSSFLDSKEDYTDFS